MYKVPSPRYHSASPHGLMKGNDITYSSI